MYVVKIHEGGERFFCFGVGVDGYLIFCDSFSHGFTINTLVTSFVPPSPPFKCHMSSCVSARDISIYITVKS